MTLFPGLKTGLACGLAVLLMFTIAEAEQTAVPDKNDRCPVCGMFVAPYPAWIATIEFNNGRREFFDGCKDLFRYYFSLPEQDATVSRSGIRSIQVTDYYTTRQIAHDQVFYILGSDVYGPMGHELIPVAGEDTAKTFLRDHRGTEILRFDQLTPQKLPAE